MIPPLAILLLAFALRVIALDSVPPGWRDDEVIETTVHAQIVLDGGWPLYFIQAEGHEPIYHYVSAGWIALVGHSLFSVRMVSVIFGLLSVAALYRLARRLFGTRAALIAALLMAVSFWLLMYSRVKIRHVAELPFVLLAFSLLWQAVQMPRRSAAQRPHWHTERSRSAHTPRRTSGVPHSLAPTLLAGLFLALALYTYLSALALLIIFVGFGLYLLVTRRVWHHAAIVLATALIIYAPLGYAITNNAERIAVVGRPLAALRSGDPVPALQNTIGTLAMFGNGGDPEWLYNISGRPVFGVVGFYFFAAGIVICLFRWRDPRFAFVLIWLIGGLAPGFVSTPAASFGHTITAMPVVYILAALPVFYFSPQSASRAQRDSKNSANSAFSAVNFLGILLFLGVAARDLPDYFWRWPAAPAVRYLYKADLHTLGRDLRGAPPATYVLNGALSKWDRRAFALEGVRFASPPRWVNAEWAIVFPPEPTEYLFARSDWQHEGQASRLESAPAQFGNGLIFEGWDQNGAEVIAHWRVGAGYSAEEPPMGASVESPPFPVFAFSHLLGADGTLVAGSDRFDADAFSLQVGDLYLQRHAFDAPPGAYTLEIGLYNPVTGERILIIDGKDSLNLGMISLP